MEIWVRGLNQQSWFIVTVLLEVIYLDTKIYKCECGKEFINRQSYVGHCGRCRIHLGEERWNNLSNSRKRPNCGGCFKGKHLTEEHKLKISNTLRNLDPGTIGRAKTEELELERRRKISESMKRNGKSGGYRKGSGIGKSGWYKGIWCDSSWELSYVIFNLENNIKFIRNKKRFYYTYKDKRHYYLPDFYLENEDKFVEIKGRETELDKIKYKSCPNLKVLYLSDMTKYIQYASDKYGKDFIKLHENKL